MTSHSIISNGGNHAEAREENDFYATEPAAADLLEYSEVMAPYIWEPACGEGHLAKRFDQLGHTVFSSDKINRGFGETIDFLAAENICCTVPFGSFDIATNPPYKLTADFIKRGWKWIENGRKLCLFLKLTFLESVARDDLFGQYPVSRIHVCRKRIKCAKNGDFSKVQSSPTCYAWFVWEKGYTGPTIIDRV